MVDPTIIEQKSDLLYPDLMFNRPINRLQMPQVGVIGGSRDNLKPLHDCYQALQACNNRIVLAVPQDVAPLLGSLAELVFVQNDKHTDDASIALRLEDCNMVVLAPGMKLTSQWHIRLEKVLTQLHCPIVFTQESLPLVAASPELLSERGGVIILTSEQAVRLANRYQLPVSIAPARGIYNKIDLMRALSEHTNAHIVLCDEHQLAVYHYSLPQAGLLQDASRNFADELYLLTGIIAALCAGVSTPTRQFEAIMNAFYVFRGLGGQTTTDADKTIRQTLENIL